ncbi:MAG: RNA polymerase sigma factor [Pirellulales bacterium]|nr:RNA polymerase sigma factor [Pirellulales bacterium]
MARSAETGRLDDLVTRHLGDALRLAIRLTGDPHWAEEVVQEALVRATRGWGVFRGEAAFRTWLFRIVIHVFRDQLPVRAKAEPLDSEPPEPRPSDPAQQVLDEELGRLVAARVSALPPRQREVLVLTAYEGLSADEVARVLGIRRANVHATLHVARQRLRAELAPYLNER